MTDDPIELVAAFAPPTTPDVRVLARVRSTLMDTIEPAIEPTFSVDRPRRRRRRFIPIAAVAAVLALSGGTAWAVANWGSSADTLNVSCPSPAGPHSAQVDPDAHTIVPTVSGDPVADCTATWRKMTTAATPTLIAYDNGHGAVVVLPTSATPPAGYQELVRGDYQQASAATLQRELDDAATGIEAQCYDFAEAKARTGKILASLGMRDWTIEQGHPGRIADGGRNCAAAGVEPGTRTVMIVGAGGFDDDPIKGFATAVHHEVERSCIGTDAARSAIRQLAAHTTVRRGDTTVDLAAPHVLDITTVADPAASCASVTVTTGGNISVTLEGPK